MSDNEQLYDDDDHKDDEFGGVYLIDEPDDIDMIIMPKLDIDIDQVLEKYAKTLRQCRTLTEAKEILLDLYAYAQAIGHIEDEIAELQNRAKSLEILMQHYRF